MKKLFLIYSALLSSGYFTSCSNLLDSKERILNIVEVPTKGYKLKVVYLPSNATIQSAIQVVKISDNKRDEILSTYERYNFIDSCKLINDTTFMIVIRDTVSYLGNHPDTMYIELK